MGEFPRAARWGLTLERGPRPSAGGEPKLLLAMPNLRAHAALLAAELATSFAGLLRAHAVLRKGVIERKVGILEPQNLADSRAREQVEVRKGGALGPVAEFVRIPT